MKGGVANGVVFNNNANVEVSWTVNIPETAKYAIKIEYYPDQNRSTSIERTLKINDKVPFAFDYADADTDVFPIKSEHGTHVSGVIVGKDDVITGVAIDAQLAIMKVFSDYKSGAEDGDVLRMTNGADSATFAIENGVIIVKDWHVEVIHPVFATVVTTPEQLADALAIESGVRYISKFAVIPLVKYSMIASFDK